MDKVPDLDMSAADLNMGSPVSLDNQVDTSLCQVIESRPQDMDAVGQERRVLKARRAIHSNVGNPDVGISDVGKSNAGKPDGDNSTSELISMPLRLEIGKRLANELENNEESLFGQRKRARREFSSDGTSTVRDSPNKQQSSPTDHIASCVADKAKRKLMFQDGCNSTLPVKKIKMVEDPVGDFSRNHCLPVIIEGAKHKDLKTIIHSTLVGVLNGEYSDVINSCTIIDGRYPYEYESGHIRGARNIYSKDQLEEFVTSECFQYLTPTDDVDAQKRNIVIFHCEFSSERGPKLMKLLRNLDRDLHRASYPSLKFPEIYLLENGYKEFYTQQPAHCQPMHYLPMNHWDYKRDLAHYKIESKMYESKTPAHTPQATDGRPKKRAKNLFD